ncbi:hypothetical protein O6H91_16G045900 [Diphasiastrum complanatum]|uniref:Uncharacterized protein n=1 Tax=Diphasiastrum complanatum TaxID=34168 RepID=A0ACC2BC17_DIPCM|nr:hypothetical protein O6H91_16G045900 [Diphasiastrum complanatum]
MLRSDDMALQGCSNDGAVTARAMDLSGVLSNGDLAYVACVQSAEWQSAGPTLSSQCVRQAEKENGMIVNQQDEISNRKLEKLDYDSTFRETFKGLVTLPKPLSISDLAKPPTHGSRLKVAYQGVPGAYSELAATKAYPDCEAVPCDQFEEAFQAVELWLSDRAVLPIENSLGGSIHRNYDLLLRHRLHIVGEVQIGVHHCLLGLPGVKKEQLKRVISHPQALAQCEHTLSKLGVAREAVDDTAGAAQYITDNNLHDTGAIASARAAELYGLDILADGIQDDSGNVTRFLMLAREPIIPRTDRPFKTSIVFALEMEQPGALFKALSAFALRDINLTKIESRPQRNRPLRVVDDFNHGVAKYFAYMFYIDFEASMAERRAQNALGQLQEFAGFLRMLGSYPMDMTPIDPASRSAS